MALQKINPSDKLESGFRVKYNDTVDEIWILMADNGDGTFRVTNFAGDYFDVSLKDSFYTKEEMTILLSVITQATETSPGIIQIATEQEVIDGESDNKAITPYTLTALFPLIGKTKIPVPDNTPILIDWQSDIVPGGVLTYAQKHGNSSVLPFGFLVDGSSESNYNVNIVITRIDNQITQVVLNDIFPGYIIIN